MMLLPSVREVARAARWLNRSGGLSFVPREAGDLLAVRLAARRRILVRSIPAGIGLFATMFVLFVLFVHEDGRFAKGLALSELDRRRVLVMGGFFGLIIAYKALMQFFVNRGDRRILAALPRPVGRVGVPPVTVVLGRLRTASLVVLGVLLAVRAAAAWATGPAPHAVAVTLLLLVCLGFSGVTVALALRRPTVAVDAASLAIDERLRSGEVFASATPLFLTLIALSGSGSGSGSGAGPASGAGAGAGAGLWELLWLFSVIGASVMLLLGSLRPPWSGRRPEGWGAPIRADDGGPQ